MPLIGCGGVHDLASAHAYLDAGATAVQVGTALLHDPTTVARLRAALAPGPRNDSRPAPPEENQ